MGKIVILNEFDYCRPDTLGEALALYGQPGSSARFLAGGTDLVVKMLGEKETPARVIDLKTISPPLRGIELAEDRSRLRIGALTTFRDLETSPLVEKYARALAEAAALVGSTPVRARGTIGGNLCGALPSADTAPPLLVLEAELILRSQAGARRLLVGDFFLGPGQCARQGGEILVAVEIPVTAAPHRSCYFKQMRRQALDLSQLGLAMNLLTDGRRITECRIALGTAAPTPVRAPAAEEFLRGRTLPLDRETIRRAAREAGASGQPRDSLRASAAYRINLMETFTERGLRRLLADV